MEVTIVVKGEKFPELEEGYAHLYRMTRYENVIHYKQYLPEEDDYESDIQTAVAELEEAPQSLSPEEMSINLCIGKYEYDAEEPVFMYKSIDIGLDEIAQVRRYLSLFYDILKDKHI